VRGFHPDYSSQDAFFDLNVPVLMYQAVAARTPYMFAVGPTTLSARTKSLDTGRFRVSIKADDATLGVNGPNPPEAQDVTEARVFLNRAPWDGGTAKTMTIKGSGTEVRATAKVSPDSRRKLAWTQAMDAEATGARCAQCGWPRPDPANDTHRQRAGCREWGPVAPEWLRPASHRR